MARTLVDEISLSTKPSQELTVAAVVAVTAEIAAAVVVVTAAVAAIATTIATSASLVGNIIFATDYTDKLLNFSA